MELAYISVDTISLRGSGMVLLPGVTSTVAICREDVIVGVSNFAKRSRRVSRLVLAEFERPQHQTDTPSILQVVISTVPSAELMAIISNMG